MSRLIIGLFCAWFLVSCKHWSTEKPVMVSPPPTEQSEISKLLSSRQRFCGMPELERAAQIAARRNSAAENTQFELLLLASCNPALTPGLLRNTLKKLANHADWTLEKQALYNLILDHSRAYDFLENEYRNLQQELDDAIKGIQQIERDMDTSDKSGVSNDK